MINIIAIMGIGKNRQISFDHPDGDVDGVQEVVFASNIFVDLRKWNPVSHVVVQNRLTGF